MRDGRLLARGRNFHVDAAHSYVSRVYTAETHRGQGLAWALMTRLLAGDRIQEALGGKSVDWMAHVSDEQYHTR